MPRFSTFHRSVLALSLVLAVGLAGCDHITEPDGPNLTDRFGPFTLNEPLMANRATVDFTAGESIVFTAAFNKQTNWVLEIVGQQSGAVRRIEGFSRELTAENARWTGRTTELPLFKAEPVTATLSFPDEADAEPTSTQLMIAVPRVYPGIVAADFEGGDNIRLGNFEFEFQGAGLNSSVPAGQGNQFYLLRGTDSNLTNFFVGLIEVLPDAGTQYYPVPTTVPEDLYLNAFLRSFGTPNTIAVVQVIADANGNGRFDDGTDTVFAWIDQPVNWTGWQLFSTSLADLGMTDQQVQEIVNIRVLLISDENAQPNPPLQVDYGIDYLTFTAGGPFEL